MRVDVAISALHRRMDIAPILCYGYKIASPVVGGPA